MPEMTDAAPWRAMAVITETDVKQVRACGAAARL